MSLDQKIEEIFSKSIEEAIGKGELGDLKSSPSTITLDKPKQADHGDKALNIAMALSKEAKLSPRKIAESIVSNLAQGSFEKVEVAGPGFINIFVDWSMFEDCIANIHARSGDYGKSSFDERSDKSYGKILVEYVSANPTGDLHIGHGRQAVLGSALVSLLSWAGYDVEAEFYVNDAGVQIEKLAKSAKEGMLVKLGFKSADDYAEDLYPLESILETFEPEDFLAEGEKISDFDKSALHGKFMDISLPHCGEVAKNKFLKLQEELLASIGVVFNTWFSERTLHRADDSGLSEVQKALKLLREKNFTYEEDGAIWFKAKEFGDERDRVLVKSDQSYTYLTGDLVYHQNKIQRGFNKLITIWGADHHGQEVGLKGCMQAMGEDPDILEVPLIQMVSLKRGDEKVKMSKRAGTVITVGEVVEEVGVDAFRYFLVESQANNHLAFDLELAKKQDKDNPVYYIQYAHARACSIERTLTQPQVNQDAGAREEAPVLSDGELKSYLQEFSSNAGLFGSLKDLGPEEKQSAKDLIIHLIDFEKEVRHAANLRAPYKIANYLKELASLFHQFYAHNRVLVDDEKLMKARLSIVYATRIVLKNGLEILGISAPDRM